MGKNLAGKRSSRHFSLSLSVERSEAQRILAELAALRGGPSETERLRFRLSAELEVAIDPHATDPDMLALRFSVSVRSVRQA